MAKLYEYSYEDLINLILELEKEKEDLNKEVESMSHGRADSYGSGWK